MHPPSHYRNHAYLPSRPPSTVLDHFAFFQPDVITSSKSVYSGRPTQAPQRSSTNSFSQFFFTSVSSNGSHSMKLKIPKVSPSSKSNHANLIIKSVPSTLYDDPAFSPDPLSHPFFATNHDAAWASPATMIHSPNLPLSLNSPALDINTGGADKPSTSIPPITSTLHNKTVGKFYTRQPSSNTSAYESQQSLTPISSTSPSTDSHRPLDTDPKPVEVPHLPLQKKKNSLTMFWQKSNNTSGSIESENSNNKLQESPPSYDTIFSARPAHSRGVSAPELRQSVERPSVLPRPATTTADSRLPPPASKRNTDGHLIRAHELDKIDELDESNPLGIPVHHGGPYEAIQKMVQPKTPHNIGSQYQDQPQKPQISKGHLNYHTAPPPIGVSLNLTPGQVLPHNFQQHYLPQQDSGRPAIRSRLHESLPSQSRKPERNNEPFENIAPKWSNHHFSLPAEDSQQ
ncbi:hypothetical protein BDZ94DRAFT_949365 [Collybia nuda]|uniref:Uncharacterized protein n=1 Tax=Collybia nuda TaxID=64659 RepID=A0A9P5Y0S7_9AGAR|nr:hypothetical protein BDZ94DRAFT_949365 [Collybia nuda]